MNKTNKTIKVPISDGDNEPKDLMDEKMTEQSQENITQDELLNEDSTPEQEIDEAQEDREEAKEPEAEDYKDQYLRTLAEFDNYKKRSEREKIEFKKFANESLLKDLLTVVDNLERAIACAADQNSGECSQTLVEGVEMTQKEILKVMEKYGVVPIKSVGEKFDPAFHQALMCEDCADHPDETVIREMQKGYLLKERLLRPALVAIAKGG